MPRYHITLTDTEIAIPFAIPLITGIPFCVYSCASSTAFFLSCWLHRLAPTIPTVFSIFLNCPLQYKTTGASDGFLALNG